jgi:hypothetical protein
MPMRNVPITDHEIFVAGGTDCAVIQIGGRAARLEKKNVVEFMRQLASHVGLRVTIHEGLILR